MADVKRCPVCNRESPPNKKFCPFDGARLVAETPADGDGAQLIVELAEGRRRPVALGAGALSIGKGSDNDLVISDPAISRHHATIVHEGGTYRIVDSGSRNGIIINGVKLTAKSWVLGDGDVVVLGRTPMRFSRRDAPRRESASAPQPRTGGRAFGWVDVQTAGEAPRRVPIVSEQIVFGRAPESDVVLPDAKISRRHVVLERVDGRWRVTNVGRNAVEVSGEVVAPAGRALTTGDVLKVGDTQLRFAFDGATGLAAGSADLSTRASAAVRASDAAPVSPFRVKDTGELFAPIGKSADADENQIVVDGKYAIEAKIAEIATGTLYRARRLALGDLVALRVLRPDLVRDPESVERFRREAQVAARIHHPNVVQVYDFGVSTEGAGFIVEELMSGRTLGDVIREQRALTLTRTVGLFNQICGAVHAANLNGIVLRDLKPESIFVERAPNGGDVVKVGGFGLAKIVGGASRGVTLAAAARIYGKPEYMSPEQWMDRPLDSRSDVYSLGVILFEMLTGAVPFTAPAPMQVAEMHLTAPVPDLGASARTDADEAIATVVERALAKEPNRRQPTALQLAAELEAAAGLRRGVVDNLIGKATGRLPIPQPYVPAAPAAAAPGEAVLPSVVAEPESRGRGAFNSVVLALMAEAFLSRISSGLVKTTVPLYALLVFGFDIASVMILVLIQNIVPLLLRPVFGTLADRYGKKRIFLFSLSVRTVVSVLYAAAFSPALFYGISVVRGLADSAKGPSVSALIADSTDEKYIARAYSFYTTVKSTSGGIGESVAAFMIVVLLALFAGAFTVRANVAVLDRTTKSGAEKTVLLADPSDVQPDGTVAGETGHVVRVEQREVRLSEVAIEDLPKVVDTGVLRRALVTIFVASAVFSLLSMLVVAIVVREKKKQKSEKKANRPGTGTGPVADAGAARRPNVWAFALLGTALTAPAYMVTGEFFTILATKLEVTPNALGWIKLIAETAIPLTVGPLFGWIADRIGPGKVIAMRSVANMLTSLLFWITPWFAGTALLGAAMGVARGVDEIGKSAFKSTWGAISAKISSYDLANRSRTMGILEGGVDASDLVFPVLAGFMLQFLPLGWLMGIRAFLALVAEIYAVILARAYRL